MNPAELIDIVGYGIFCIMAFVALIMVLIVGTVADILVNTGIEFFRGREREREHLPGFAMFRRFQTHPFIHK